MHVDLFVGTGNGGVEHGFKWRRGTRAPVRQTPNTYNVVLLYNALKQYPKYFLLLITVISLTLNLLFPFLLSNEIGDSTI